MSYKEFVLYIYGNKFLLFSYFILLLALPYVFLSMVKEAKKITVHLKNRVISPKNKHECVKAVISNIFGEGFLKRKEYEKTYDFLYNSSDDGLSFSEALGEIQKRYFYNKFFVFVVIFIISFISNIYVFCSEFSFFRSIMMDGSKYNRAFFSFFVNFVFYNIVLFTNIIFLVILFCLVRRRIRLISEVAVDCLANSENKMVNEFDNFGG